MLWRGILEGENREDSVSEIIGPIRVHPLRKSCSGCNGATGRIETRNGQDCVYCATCGKWQYNAPKTETGREVRTVSTVHEALKPKQRARILLRANSRCELCGKADAVLHVGHLISVKHGLMQGLTELEINDDENLCCLCDECNLGLGEEPVSLRFAVALVMARIRNRAPAQ